MKGAVECNIVREIGGFPVLKKDDSPSYQVACLPDDLHFGILRIVHGEEMIPSAAAQLALDAELNSKRFDKIDLPHHPLVTDKSGRKLSNSAGDSVLANSNKNRKQLTETKELVRTRLSIEKPLRKPNDLREASQNTCMELLHQSFL